MARKKSSQKDRAGDRTQDVLRARNEVLPPQVQKSGIPKKDVQNPNLRIPEKFNPNFAFVTSIRTSKFRKKFQTELANTL